MDACKEISDASSDETLPSKEKPVRKTISQRDKMKLVEAMEKGESFHALGKQMGIAKSTINSIIYLYNQTGKVTRGKPGTKNTKISEEMPQKLLNFIDKNYCSTLEEMSKYLSQQNIHISIYSISRFLKKNFVTFRKVRSCIVDKNSDSVLELRKTYVRRLLEQGWSNKKTLYIDECYFNTWARKTTGRSENGERIFVKVPTTVGPNICLVLAMGVNGPIHHKLLIGSLAKESYQTFINEVTTKLNETGFILVHDNVRIYDENISPNNQMVKLPPYSSFLNPIEEVFIKIKENLRKSMSNIQGFVSMNVNNRFIILNDAINKELKKEDYSDLKSYYKHIRKFFPKSLLKEVNYEDE